MKSNVIDVWDKKKKEKFFNKRKNENDEIKWNIAC